MAYVPQYYQDRPSAAQVPHAPYGMQSLNGLDEAIVNNRVIRFPAGHRPGTAAFAPGPHSRLSLTEEQKNWSPTVDNRGVIPVTGAQRQLILQDFNSTVPEYSPLERARMDAQQRADARHNIATSKDMTNRQHRQRIARMQEERLQSQLGRGAARYDFRGDVARSPMTDADGNYIPRHLRGAGPDERLDAISSAGREAGHYTSPMSRLQQISADPQMAAAEQRRMGEMDAADEAKQRADYATWKEDVDESGMTLAERASELQHRMTNEGRLRQGITPSPGNPALKAAVLANRAAKRDAAQSLITQRAQMRQAGRDMRMGQPFQMPGGMGVGGDGGGVVPPMLWNTNPRMAAAMQQSMDKRAELAMRREELGAERTFKGNQAQLERQFRMQGWGRQDAREKASQVFQAQQAFNREQGLTTRHGETIGLEEGRIAGAGTAAEKAATAARRESLDRQLGQYIEGRQAAADSFGDTDYYDEQIADTRRKLAELEGGTYTPPAVGRQGKASPQAKARGKLQGDYDAWATLGEDTKATHYSRDPTFHMAGGAAAGKAIADGIDGGTVTDKNMPQIITALTSNMSREHVNKIKASPTAYGFTENGTQAISGAEYSAMKVLHHLLNGRNIASIDRKDIEALRSY